MKARISCAPLVAFRELVAAILGECLHALPHGAGGEAEAFHDRVHLGMQRLELLLAHGVHFIRRHARRRRGLQRPAVELVAVRARPHAGIVLRDFPLRFELGDLPIERRRDLLRRDRPRALRPVTGNRLRAPRDRLDEHAAGACVLRRQAHLLQRLVDQECRRHESLAARGFNAAALTIELLRERLHASQIRLGIGGVLDRMIAVEEARDVEIGADVLDHHIRRVAPAADGDVAVWQRKAVGRDLIGAAHDLDAGASRMRESEVSIALARSRSCRTWVAIFCCPSADRSASCERNAARVHRYRRRARWRFRARNAGSSRPSDRASPWRRPRRSRLAR